MATPFLSKNRRSQSGVSRHYSLWIMHTKRERPMPFPLKKFGFYPIFLLKVPFQQTLESLAVTSFIAGHLVDGVVECVAIATQGDNLLSKNEPVYNIF